MSSHHAIQSARSAALPKLIVQLLLTAAMLVLFCTTGRAQMAMDFTGVGGALFQTEATFGWSFEVHHPVRVTRLGFFDDFIVDGVGLNHDHLVRIWTDDGSEQLLAGATITPTSATAPSTAQDGQWFLEDITPIVLQPGDYVVGADDPFCGPGDCDRIRYLSNVSTIPEISHKKVRNASGLGFPSATTFNREDGYFGPTFHATPLPGPDLNTDDRISCLDVDSLVAEIVAGTNTNSFDMTGDGNVNHEDLTEWLAQAGAINLATGASYPVGDATLDGNVDDQDYAVWNANKFTSTAAWCSGDFNADGNINGRDFLLWNSHKFTSAASSTVAIPEPSGFACLLMLGVSGLVVRLPRSSSCSSCTSTRMSAS